MTTDVKWALRLPFVIQILISVAAFYVMSRAFLRDAMIQVTQIKEILEQYGGWSALFNLSQIAEKIWGHLEPICTDPAVTVLCVVCNAVGFVYAGLARMRVAYAPPRRVKLMAYGWFIAVPAVTYWTITHWSALPLAQFASWISQPLGWWLLLGQSTPEARHSDVRKLWERGVCAKPYSVLDYIDIERGHFIGLDERDEPVFIPVEDSRRHAQLLGETRMGKTLSAQIYMQQHLMRGESIIVFDPKADAYMPRVMTAMANRAKVPFYFLDLRSNQPPQFNIFNGASPDEIEELFVQGMFLQDQGDMADVYRGRDRAAARIVANLGVQSISEMLASGLSDERVANASRFCESLKELAACTPIQTAHGLNLNEVVGTHSILYIVGSVTHERTIMLQKFLLQRILQIISHKGLQSDARWVTLFLDELKHILSPSALRAMSLMADRRCHALVAHQSLKDLQDCGPLDPQAVYGAIVANTGLKALCKTNDPETAQWGARLSGSIPAFTEVQIKTVLQFWNPGGSWVETKKPLVDENVFLSLPPLHAVVLCVGAPKLVRVSYLPLGDWPQVVSAPPNRSERREELI